MRRVVSVIMYLPPPGGASGFFCCFFFFFLDVFRTPPGSPANCLICKAKTERRQSSFADVGSVSVSGTVD